MRINKFLLACYVVSVFPMAADAEDFSPKLLQQIYGELKEAVCILTFTQEATDPRTGEQQRQVKQS